MAVYGCGPRLIKLGLLVSRSTAHITTQRGIFLF
jgi:hypothetical protein